MYEGHFGTSSDHTYVLRDIRKVYADQLPAGASVAWASSPCTDLSLAGARAGLAGAESGTFWEFIRILKDFNESRPPIAVLENVVGLATSHAGEDLAAAVKAFNELGYSVDVLVIDARRFIPQSRPRLFLVAAQNPPNGRPQTDSTLRPDFLQPVFGDPTLTTHRAHLPEPPALLTSGFGMCVEEMPLNDERWWDEERTEAFMSSLSPTQYQRVMQMHSSPGVKYRTAYRRTRKGIPVWEVRPDDVSGCLRTARGGSSKQAVLRVDNSSLHVRWMTPREYARLMGAGEYKLDGIRANKALFGFGDAVAAPVVQWLSEKYLLPLLREENFTEPEMMEIPLGQ
ncbi:Modification methylase HpaII [Nocardiopsis dassonvillei]|nr:Modification methylase HpaII [Nocardiopsis dassonvillei]